MRFLIISLILCCCQFGWSQTSAPTPSDSLKLINYRGYGIELQVPEFWDITQDYAKDVQVMFTNKDTTGKDSTFENITLVTERIPLYNLRSYFKISKRNIGRRLLDVVFLSEGEKRISDYDSKWMIVTHRYAGRTFKVKNYYFVKHGYGYIFIFTTSPEDFDEQVKVSDRVMETLRITR